jgi:hypothetical protein
VKKHFDHPKHIQNAKLVVLKNQLIENSNNLHRLWTLAK